MYLASANVAPAARISRRLFRPLLKGPPLPHFRTRRFPACGAKFSAASTGKTIPPLRPGRSSGMARTRPAEQGSVVWDSSCASGSLTGVLRALYSFSRWQGRDAAGRSEAPPAARPSWQIIERSEKKRIPPLMRSRSPSWPGTWKCCRTFSGLPTPLDVGLTGGRFAALLM